MSWGLPKDLPPLLGEEVSEMPGWWDVRSVSLHRVVDGGYGRMRTACGIRVRAAFREKASKRPRCQSCEKKPWRAE